MNKDTRNLIVFFLTTFAWTWACYSAIVISGHSPYGMPWLILLIAGGMGPSLIGVLLILFTYDKARRYDYWRRCFSFRQIKLAWWAVILLIFPSILVVSVAVDIGLGGSPPGMKQLKELISQPIFWPTAALLSFFSGPWSEEFGWRGYALDPLVKRFGVIPGSIMLGSIWGLWHLPLFFMPATWHGQIGFKLEGFWTFIIWNVGLALLMTQIYIVTNRSILSALMLHFTANFSAQLISPSSDRLEVIRAICLLLLALYACLLFERRNSQRETQTVRV